MPWVPDQSDKYKEYELPKVSIIIPTYNSATLIGLTLESVVQQNYPDFEILIIDGGSEDRTLEVIKSLRESRIRVYSISGYARYEMLNKGITHVRGIYVNFLFPGDYYLNQNTLRWMMGQALGEDKPGLVYCGTVLRDVTGEVKTLYRPWSEMGLRSGKQPTSLQACWFRADLFRLVGKFNTQLTLRGGFDLMCRILLHPNLKVSSISRILVDYDLRQVTRKNVLAHFWETWSLVWHYFGLGYAFLWLFKQKDSKRYFNLWLKSLHTAFLGPR